MRTPMMAERPPAKIVRAECLDALAYARHAHGNQVDLSGAPYTDHLERVWTRLLADPDIPTLRAALLHDVLEDTGLTVAELDADGFGEVIPVVEAVTRQDGETYEDFICRLVAGADVRAQRLKLADLMDNLAPARVALQPSRSRVTRYLSAAEALINILAERAQTVRWGDLERQGDLEFVGGQNLTGDARRDRALLERALAKPLTKNDTRVILK